MYFYIVLIESKVVLNPANCNEYSTYWCYIVAHTYHDGIYVNKSSNAYICILLAYHMI